MPHILIDSVSFWFRSKCFPVSFKISFLVLGLFKGVRVSIYLWIHQVFIECLLYCSRYFSKFLSNVFWGINELFQINAIMERKLFTKPRTQLTSLWFGIHFNAESLVNPPSINKILTLYVFIKRFCASEHIFNFLLSLLIKSMFS